MPVTIRNATQKDFPAIIDLIKEFAIFQKTPWKVSITLEEMERNKDFFNFFVAVADQEKIIGFTSFYFTFFSWSGKGLFLDDLYVTQQYRNQKIGTQLLNRVIELAKGSNVKNYAGRFPTGIKMRLTSIKRWALRLMRLILTVIWIYSP